MRFIFYLLQLPVLLVLTMFAISNRDPIELTLWPLPWNITIPGFLPILGCLLLGYIFGRIHSSFGHKTPKTPVASKTTATVATDQKLITERTSD
ncbi:MAG: hypothetical protein AAF352_04165 [Pseudomonadota bacterium]